jgi:hypothetical protein
MLLRVLKVNIFILMPYGTNIGEVRAFGAVAFCTVFNMALRASQACPAMFLCGGEVI